MTFFPLKGIMNENLMMTPFLLICIKLNKFSLFLHIVRICFDAFGDQSLKEDFISFFISFSYVSCHEIFSLSLLFLLEAIVFISHATIIITSNNYNNDQIYKNSLSSLFDFILLQNSVKFMVSVCSPIKISITSCLKLSSMYCLQNLVNDLNP